MSSSLAERVRRARKLKGLSQKQLADAVGISRNAVTEWENGGTKTINSERLHRAAATLGVDAHWLATGANKADGHRIEPSDPIDLLPDDERQVVLRYRRADARGKDIITEVAEIQANYSPCTDRKK